MTFRRLIVPALACALLAAAPGHRSHRSLRSHPSHLTVYSAPAGDRPAGLPKPRHSFDAVLPDGRIMAPVGQSRSVGGKGLGMALTPDGRYLVVSTRQADGDGLLTLFGAASLADLATSNATGLTFAKGVAAVPDPTDWSRTLLLVPGGNSGALAVFDLSGAAAPAFERSIRLDSPDAVTVSADHRIAYVAGANGEVTAVDLASRTSLGEARVGFAPVGLAYTHRRLYAINSGLSAYPPLAQPLRVPAFAGVPADPYRASSLSAVPLAPNGGVTADASAIVATRMDVSPDTVGIVGGAKPSALVVSKDGRYAYVCMANVDRVAVVALQGYPHVIAGIQLRLFNLAPYGTRPEAIARSRDGKRLYIALAGINAVAVVEVRKDTHLHRLGLIPTGWAPSALTLSKSGRYLFVLNARGTTTGATLQRIDLRKLPLEKTTLSALRYLRVARIAHANPLVPPLRSRRRSSAVSHVVLIRTADPTLLSLPASEAPNVHALAAAFASAQNVYTGGSYGVENSPDDYPRDGYIFNALLRAHVSYRDYGAFLDLLGSQPDASADGIGLLYTRDVPALAALDGRVDLNYPAPAAAATDAARAAEFARDFAEQERRGDVPDFTEITLAGKGAESDAAIGTVVAFLTHQPSWPNTAIFVVPQGGAWTPSYVLTISPYAKRGYATPRHLSTAGVRKTIEELLGLPPVVLRDLVASDMADCFTPIPDSAPFDAIGQSGTARNVEPSAQP